MHEEPIFEGSLGYLKNPLIHRKNITISEMVDKTNNWSEIEARLMFEAKHRHQDWDRHKLGELFWGCARLWKWLKARKLETL